MLFVFLGGGSASGKSVIAKVLAELLTSKGFCPVTIRVDDYYKQRPSSIPSEQYVQKTNFDVPEAVDLPLLRDHLLALHSGTEISKPVYDFKTQQVASTVPIHPSSCNVVIVEGLYALKVAELVRYRSESIPRFGIYVEPQTYFSMIEQRIERDGQGDRGSRPREKVLQLERKTVGIGFFLHVAPTLTRADMVLTNKRAQTPEEAKRNCLLLAQQAFNELESKLPKITPSNATKGSQSSPAPA